MPGYNLQTYKDSFLRQVFGWDNYSTLPPSVGDDVMLALFNDALLEIQRRTDISSLRQTANLGANQLAYAVPTTLLGRRIDRVEVLNRTGNGRTTLIGIPYNQFTPLYDQDNPSSNTGNPIHWTFGVADQGQILIGPPSKYSRTNGLIITAVVQPEMVGRNYQSANPPLSGAAVTATFTLASNDVTLSADTPAAIELVANDDIGVVPTEQSDGSTTTTRSPRKWYRVTAATSGSTAVTIQPVFNARTISGASFISAEVPEIEIVVPGLIGMLPVYMALAEYLKFKEPGKAEFFQAKVEDEFTKLRPQSPRVRHIHSGPVQAQSSFFERQLGRRIWLREDN